MLATTGTVPDVDTTVDVQGHALKVVSIDGHKITQVRVERTAEPEPVATEEHSEHH